MSLTADEQSDLRAVFEGALTTNDHYWVSFEDLGENASPVVITQSEFMRRMKDMAAMSPTSNLYSGMPDSRNLVVNVSHPLVKTIIEGKNKQLSDKLAQLNEKIKPVKARVDELEKTQKDKKDEEIPQAEKDALTDAEKQLDTLEEERTALLKGFGKDFKLVKQLIDLALLANNMLKGEDLSRFVKRSLELIKVE